MRRMLVSGWLSLIGMLVFVLLSPRFLLAASPNHTKTTFVEPFDLVIPAADGCSGEDVHVFGDLDITVQTTTDSSGGLHTEVHLVPQLTGVGLSTGLEYIAVGPTHVVTFINGTGASVLSGVNITRLISPGSTDNLVLNQTIHVTVNANGTTTVEFDRVTFVCRGQG